MEYIRLMPLGWFLCSCRKIFLILSNSLLRASSHFLSSKEKGPGRICLTKKIISCLSIVETVIVNIAKGIKRAEANITDWLGLLKKRETRGIEWDMESIVSYSRKDTHLYRRCSVLVKRLNRRNSNYNLVGISVTHLSQLLFALILARVVKCANKEVLIVLGGAQITKYINELIAEKRLVDFIDGFVVGDGEEPLYQLINNSSSKNFSSVPNFFYKYSNNSSLFYKRSDNVFLFSSNEYTVPDFTNFSFGHYEFRLPIAASSGCWWGKCAFCLRPVRYGKDKHIIFSADKVVNVIKQLNHKYNIGNFVFVDDAISSQFMLNISECLIDKNISVKWSGVCILSRDFLDDDFCKLLSKSGCRHLSIGLESVSPRILTAMNKYHRGMAVNEIIKVLIMLKKHNIFVSLHVMFGFPTESINEAEMTLEFLIKHRGLYDSLIPHLFSLTKDTPVYKYPHNFSITNISDKPVFNLRRLGFDYEAACGMNMHESESFFVDAIKRLRINKITIIEYVFQ
ncbi:MAG: radical SAM protein [Candidatus Omnitrophica bacterium]|nr:radical SAM protein [Candidatus Omnitrophota bacterium]